MDMFKQSIEGIAMIEICMHAMLSIQTIAFIFYQKITPKDDILDQKMTLLIPGTAVTSASPSVKLYAGPLESFCIVWTWRYDRLLYELRKYLFASGFQIETWNLKLETFNIHAGCGVFMYWYDMKYEDMGYNL